MSEPIEISNLKIYFRRDPYGIFILPFLGVSWVKLNIQIAAGILFWQILIDIKRGDDQ